MHLAPHAAHELRHLLQSVSSHVEIFHTPGFRSTEAEMAAAARESTRKGDKSDLKVWVWPGAAFRPLFYCTDSYVQMIQCVESSSG